MMKKIWVTGTLASLSLIGAITSASAAQVDITNSNGTVTKQLLSSNGGLDSKNFSGTTGNGVSVWLRARNQGDGAPLSKTGTLFKIRKDDGTNQGPKGAAFDDFYFEFQFSPENDQPADGSGKNYIVELSLDNDPSTGVNFSNLTLSLPVFDNDSDDSNSWDDQDTFVEDNVTVRGGQTVDFTSTRTGSNSPEYVLVNSWTPEYGFLFGTAPSVGFYDLRLSASYENDELASQQITVQVGEPTSVPLPATWLLVLTGLIGCSVAGKHGRRAKNT